MYPRYFFDLSIHHILSTSITEVFAFIYCVEYSANKRYPLVMIVLCSFLRNVSKNLKFFMCFLTERNESTSFCVYKRTCRNCHQTHRTWSTTWCCQFCKLILSHYDYSEHNLASFDSLIVYCFLSYARFFFIIWSRLHGVRSTTCFWVVGFFARSMNIYVCLPSWPKKT